MPSTATRRKPTPREDERLLTGNEVMERLSISHVTLRVLVRRGILRPIPIGTRNVRYRASDVLAFMAHGVRPEGS